MQCPDCGEPVPDGSRFCPGCGARLPLICPDCGSPAPAGGRFCPACGRRLAEDGPGDAQPTAGAAPPVDVTASPAAPSTGLPALPLGLMNAFPSFGADLIIGGTGPDGDESATEGSAGPSSGQS